MITTNKTKTPLCILIDKDEINKDYFINKDFNIYKTLYLDKDLNININNDNKEENEEDEEDDYINNSVIIDTGKYTAFPKPGEFFRCFIFGSSGSGKTTLLCNLLNILNHQNNKMFVLFISSIFHDDKLDKELKKLFKHQLLKITQEGYIKDVKREFPITLNELFIFIKQRGFESCTVCFDDCDSMTNKNVKYYVNMFMNEILERGRSHTKNEPNINLICIKHEAAGLDTKKLFLECEYIYFNLQVLHQQRLLYLCNKFNLEPYKDLLLERKKLGDNMCCVSTHYPFYFFTNKIVCLIK